MVHLDLVLCEIAFVDIPLICIYTVFIVGILRSLRWHLWLLEEFRKDLVILEKIGDWGDCRYIKLWKSVEKILKMVFSEF